MDEPLDEKRKQAAAAMSSGVPIAQPAPAAVTPEPVPVFIAPIPTPPTTDGADSMKIAERRLQAQIAMEGDERKKKRDEAIRAEKEAAEKVRREEEEKKRQQFEQEKIAREKTEQETRIRQQREQMSKQLNQQVEEIKGSSAGLRTVRTLKQDQDNLIKTQNISLVGIAIKEEERRRQRQENTSLSSGKNLKLLAASLTLIVLSMGIGLYVYNIYYATVPLGILPGNDALPQSLLFSDSTKSLNTTDITYDDLMNRIKNEIRNPPDLRLGAVENYVLIKKNDRGIATPLNSAEFFKIIASNAPDSFRRSISPQYMYGILSSAENAAFIIVKADAYDKGLAGLLEWEKTTLTKDLYTILTSLKPDPELLTKNFEDLLIKNIDTRVLRDKDGAIRIVYGFLDGEKTIAIAGSQQAFIEALNRFNAPKPLSQ